MTMHRTPPHQFLLAMLAAGAATLGVARIGCAQIGLPEATSTATQLSGEQQAALKTFVDENKSGLSAEQATGIRRAKGALEAPLRVLGVSVDFRTRYSDALVPVLKPLVSSARAEVAINALHLAGALGTKQGIDLLDVGLADKRQNVRFMAASSYVNPFRAAREGQPAISNSQALGVVEGLNKALNAETQPMVQDALVLSLGAACEVPVERLEGVRDRAAEVLAASAGQLARKQPANAIQFGAIIHAGKTLFDLLANPNIKLSSKALVESGGYAGDVLAMARRRLGAGQALDDAERAQLALTVGQATRVYYFAHQNLGGKPVDAKPDDAIAKGDDERFKAESGKLIDAGGALLGQPFGLAAERFSK